MASPEDSKVEAGISSDEIDKPLICQPCKEEGETLAAFGHCANCSEYLCKKCFDVHLIPSITKRHVLEILEKEHTVETETISKYSCQHHGDKNIEFHCPTHSFLGCHICFFQNHRNCKDVICIPEAATTARNSDDLHQFYEKIANINSKCSEFLSEIRLNKQNIALNQKEAKFALENFKQEIFGLINSLEQDLINKIDNQQREETARMEELSLKCETLLKETRDISTTVENLHNKEHNCEVYVELVTSKDKVWCIEEQVREIETRKETEMIMFQENKDLVVLLKSLQGFGKLISKRTIKKVDYKGSFNCKLGSDTGNCDIRSMVLLPGKRLLFSDWVTGNTVKLFDIQKDKFISHIKLSSGTYGACMISEFLVAVTVLSDKRVTILKTDPVMAIEREIKVNEEPWGIDHLDGKLVVSYNQSRKIEIMDLQGKVSATYSTDGNGHALFNNPYHVAINQSNKRIYISNYLGNNVVCMTLEGSIMATYEDKDLKNPRQVTFDCSDMVLVCGQGSNNVHQISKDCKKIKLIINSTDGLSSPTTICHQVDDRLLYISHSTCNEISVYTVKYSYH